MKQLVFSLVVLAGLAVAVAQAAEPKHAAAKADMPTCGQMVSGMAAIPAKLAEGAESVADMWEAHAALLGKDKDSQAEAKALRALAKGHKQIAASLRKESEEMKKASGWPAAPHDMAKMSSDPKLTAAGHKLMEAQKEIIALMQKSLADMEAMHKQAK
jgi:hypothetical protein